MCVRVCVVWRGEREGCVIINIRSCRETKGLKWKGLAGRGDLAMSCTSVIFLLRLELSQGFNWNPDFKEALAPPFHPPLLCLSPARVHSLHPPLAAEWMQVWTHCICAYSGGYKTTVLLISSQCFFLQIFLCAGAVVKTPKISVISHLLLIESKKIQQSGW